MRHYIRLILIFILSSLSFQAFSAVLDTKQNQDVFYFLFSNPNKIVRYDLTTQQFLSDISLDEMPTAFEATDNAIYVAFNRVLKKIDPITFASEFVRNSSTEIQHLTTVNNYLIVTESNSNVTSLTLDSHAVIQTRYSFYSGNGFIGADSVSAYFYRTTGVSPSDIRKVIIDSSGTTVSDKDSPYHGNYPTAQRLYINSSENKIYDDAGISYFTSDLSYHGSLAGAVDDISFIDDNPVSLKGNTLTIYNPSNIELGQFILNIEPEYITGYNDQIFSFNIVNDAVSVQLTDVSNLHLPSAGEPKDPVGFAYMAERIEHDGSDIIYLYDREALSIFRWSKSTGQYLTTWPLLFPPDWMTFSNSHNRLYLGYNSGKITYFDSSSNTAIETHFISLATAVNGLLSIGDFLFAVDSSGAWFSHYSFDSNAALLDSKEWRHPAAEYVWEENLGRVFHYRDGTSPNDLEWTSIDSSTGLFISHGDSPYHGGTLQTKYPLRVSYDGSLILNGAGQFIDSNDLTVVNVLSNDIADAVWVYDQLVTLKTTGQLMQFWDNTYNLDFEYKYSSTDEARILSLNDQLGLITYTLTGPTFTFFDVKTPADTDNDGIVDLRDNCLSISNLNQLDTDNDALGDACDLDDDNDGIEDLAEIAAGLDPLDKTDANGDLDGDGFSNLLEDLLQSKINDQTSIPAQISDYEEGFENGFPKGFYNNSSNYPWAIKAEPSSGAYSFGSSFFNQPDQSSQIDFTSYYQQGALSFQHKAHGFYSERFRLEVYVDGILQPNVIPGNDWFTYSIPLTSGVHTLSLKVVARYNYGDENDSYFLIDNLKFEQDSDGDGIGDSIDNCPALINTNQYDSDKDGIGNECDLDPYNQDDDNDGYGNSLDNCPSIYNPNQLNLDGDYYGNVCDDDIDGDGISLENEELYSFLSDYNANDALLDEDNDGQTNLTEITYGTNPEIFNSAPGEINLEDYYPLTSRIATFNDLNGSFNVTTTKISTNNYLEVDSFGFAATLQKTDKGIFITKLVDRNTGTTIEFSNYPLMPSKLILNRLEQSNISFTQFENGEAVYSNLIYYQIEITAIGEQLWNGKVYPSVTIQDNIVGQRVYLKGIGLFSSDEGYQLKSIEENKGSSGVGALNPLFFMIIALLHIYRRLKANN